MEATKDQIAKRIEDLFRFFDVKPELTFTDSDGVIIIDIQTSIDEAFTGRSVDPLLALQHILRVIAKTDFKGSEVRLSLNMGGFKQAQADRLTSVAQDAANQVRATQTAVYLPPMSSYERRLVHMALSNEADLVTESEGTGPTRRVIVRPKS